MSSLIPAGNQFAVAAAVFGLAALGMYLERFGVGRKLSGALIALGLGLILSNLRVLPFTAPTYDFVNSYRVEEVQRRLVDPSSAHLTVLAIGLEAGFNSKSSFNAVFKKHTKMTPSQYQQHASEGAG